MPSTTAKTLATMLHNAGYATIYLGKYLNRYGFDPAASSGHGKLDSLRATR